MSLFLLAAQFMTVIMLAASLAPGYDFAGGAERMIVYPPMLWMMAFGGYLLGTPADVER